MHLMKHSCKDILACYEWVDVAKASVVKAQLARYDIQYMCFGIIDPGQ